MGREAECLVEFGPARDEARVHLDTDQIQFRGGVKGVVRFAEMKDLAVRADALEARTPQGALRIHLGAVEARKWLEKIQHPPSLASKLGLKAGTRVVLVGREDAEIRAVWTEAGCVESAPREAELAFVLVDSAPALAGLAKALQPLAKAVPVWLLRLKGKDAPVSEAAVRAEMQRLGYGAAKTARWSDERGADRFHAK